MSGALTVWQFADNLQALYDTRDGADDPVVIAEIDKAIEVQFSNIAQKADGIYEFLSRAESEGERLKAEVDGLQKRRRSISARMDWVKSNVLAFLQATEQKDLRGEIHKLYRQNNSEAALDILDEKQIPWRFIDVVVEHKVRKDEVTKALLAGEVITGAKLNRGEHIRRR